MIQFSFSLPLGILTAAILLISVVTLIRNMSKIIRPSERSYKQSKQGPSHLVAVLGSGGHSTEMVSLLKNINFRRYTHRTYIASIGDGFAVEKACQIESIIQSKQRPLGPAAAEIWDLDTGIWDVKFVPRAREIHQSIYTTPFSSLWCAIGCVRVLRSIAKSSRVASNSYPDVIVANGPATAVIVILTSTMLKFLRIAPPWKMKVVYVESWARVKNLSMSGRLVLTLGISDRFLVQWEKLEKKINRNGVKKVEWAGFLVD